MINGKTRSGFEFSVDMDSLQDDWEYAELLGELEDHPEKQPRIMRVTLGEKQYKSLKEHCRENGKISTTRMGKEIEDIFAEIGKGDSGKN
jgi:hypothetical protein